MGASAYSAWGLFSRVYAKRHGAKISVLEAIYLDALYMTGAQSRSPLALRVRTSSNLAGNVSGLGMDVAEARIKLTLGLDT